MPQSVTVRVHKTITLALTDLTTVTLSNADGAEIYVKNTGPGKVYISFDPTKPASTTTPADNVFLATGDYIYFRRIPRNTVCTMMADTAATIVTMTQS
jgi:hypothetical protein